MDEGAPMAKSPKFRNYRFIVTQPGFEPAMLKALLMLAMKEAELIYPKAKLKLDVTYELSANRPVCAIEVETECGEHVANLLSGFLIKQVGEQGFRVARLGANPWKR
jgi:hypothetical protein